ncbi:hypothetical protein PANA5342_2248 [Pantoea ananatis LMG 5342]|jgi:hypothetical protein|nr:hypothetical protein PANA5342_2248 [Pantoea ananatis LMG 5342]
MDYMPAITLRLLNTRGVQRQKADLSMREARGGARSKTILWQAGRMFISHAIFV